MAIYPGFGGGPLVDASANVHGINSGALSRPLATTIPVATVNRVVAQLLQRGYVDVGFMGGAQIDQFGNLNSSFIGDPKHPKTRLPGTGGGNDISSLTEMIVAIKHEKRRFVENVDFVTSPGWLRGEDTRRQSGLPNGGMYRVITDLAVFGFDETTRRMKPIALNPGVTREQVQDNTGFKLEFDHNTGVTEPPTDHELTVLRELDPERLYIA